MNVIRYREKKDTKRKVYRKFNSEIRIYQNILSAWLLFFKAAEFLQETITILQINLFKQRCQGSNITVETNS